MYMNKLNDLNLHPREVGCLATVTHNLKWMKITHISFICDQTFANHFIPNILQ